MNNKWRSRWWAGSNFFFVFNILLSYSRHHFNGNLVAEAPLFHFIVNFGEKDLLYWRLKEEGALHLFIMSKTILAVGWSYILYGRCFTLRADPLDHSSLLVRPKSDINGGL